jgi:tRNA-2-methylthio-N6-dimethylallyladenosine synthase
MERDQFVRHLDGMRSGVAKAFDAIDAREFTQQRAFNAAQVGRVLPILVSGNGRRAGQKHGRSPYLQAVHFDDARARPGDIVPVQILSASQNSLAGARLERTPELA